jgi:hypothetical protein
MPPPRHGANAPRGARRASPERRTTLRSQMIGCTHAAPSSAAFWMIQSILSALGKALHEPDLERGFAIHVAPRAELHVDAIALDALDHRFVFPAAAVEHRERVAAFQAQ